MANSNIVQTVTLTAGAAVPLYRFVEIQSDGKVDTASPGYVGGTSMIMTITANATPASAGTFRLLVNGHVQNFPFDVAAASIQGNLRATLALVYADADLIIAVATTGTDLGDASAVVTITFPPTMGDVIHGLDVTGLTGNVHVTAVTQAGVDPTLTGAIDGISAGAAAADGDPISISLPLGINKVEAGAAVSLGDQVTTDSVGRVVTHVSGAGNSIAGKALDAASAAGEIIRVYTLILQDGLT